MYSLYPLNCTSILCSQSLTPNMIPPPITITFKILSTVYTPLANINKERSPHCNGCLTQEQIPSIFSPPKSFPSYGRQVTDLEFRISPKEQGIRILSPSSSTDLTRKQTPTIVMGREMQMGIVKTYWYVGWRLLKMAQSTSPLIMLKIYLSQSTQVLIFLKTLSLYLKVDIRICWSQKVMQRRTFLIQWVYQAQGEGSSGMRTEGQSIKGILRALQFAYRTIAHKKSPVLTRIAISMIMRWMDDKGMVFFELYISIISHTEDIRNKRKVIEPVKNIYFVIFLIHLQKMQEIILDILNFWSTPFHKHQKCQQLK